MADFAVGLGCFMVALLIFGAGLWIGHMWGWDEGWRDKEDDIQREWEQQQERARRQRESEHGWGSVS